MARKKNNTEQKKVIFIEAYRQSLCIIQKACELSEVGRTQYYTWLKEDDAFRDAIENIEPIQIEFVENALMKRIGEGSDSSIQFYLKTKGKSSGYATQIDITTGGEKLNQISVIKLIEYKKNEDDDKTEKE
jgi:hypothetical protein